MTSNTSELRTSAYIDWQRLQPREGGHWWGALFAVITRGIINCPSRFQYIYKTVPYFGLNSKKWCWDRCVCKKSVSLSAYLFWMTFAVRGFGCQHITKNENVFQKRSNVIAIPFYMLPYLPFKDDVFQWFLVALWNCVPQRARLVYCVVWVGEGVKGEERKRRTVISERLHNRKA